MSCATIENLFIEHAGLIRNDVAKSIQQTDFYINSLPKEQWLDGQGYQYQYPVYERALPSSQVTWEAMATLNETPNSQNNLPDTGACSLTGQKIDSFPITLRSVTLKKAALNSPDICLDDLRFQWQIMDQIKNVTRVLSENSKHVWANAYQDEYIEACGNKMIATTDLPTADAWDDVKVAPTSKLTWGVLEYIHELLDYAGGSLNPTTRDADGTPVYAVVGDRYVFSDLKRQDSNTRDDFHYGAPEQMLNGPSLKGIYRGFQFNTVQFAPRYDLVDGEWVRRYPYDPADPTSYLNATRGKKFEVGNLYKNAAFTDTVIFLKDVMNILVPRPSGSYGKMTYNPSTSWAGEFNWRNIPDRTCNIDGNKGFFRALFAYGAQVVRPDLGFVVRHLRCDRGLDLLACS